MSEGVDESEEISDKISDLSRFRKISDVSPSALKNEVSQRDNLGLKRTKSRVDHLLGQGEGRTGLEMFAMDDLALNEYQGLNTSDEEDQEPSNLKIWQQSMQLNSQRDEEAKKRVDKYIRVKEFAV